MAEIAPNLEGCLCRRADRLRCRRRGTVIHRATGHEWLSGICALLAGLAPAIYKALDYDVGLNTVAQHARQFKGLQDRFRQSWRVTALGQPDELKKEFDALMAQLDIARSASLTPPERYFKKAQSKIHSGDYDFSIDVAPIG